MSVNIRNELFGIFSHLLPKQRKLCLENVECVEIDGINHRDAPDYCDAYICRAVWTHNGKELTEPELEILTENSYEYISEHCFESAVCEAEYNMER